MLSEPLNELWESGYQVGFRAGVAKTMDDLEPMMVKLNEILAKVENHKEESK
jgi:hypothetical protein